MKKLLLSILAIGLGAQMATAQTRYLEEVFTDVDKNSGVTFASNYNFLLPTPIVTSQTTDVYRPAGDSETNRAAVILLHTGNFLPRYLNQSPTGSNQDSSIVVSAELFAKRGYVAFAPSYRLGWDPANSDPNFGLGARRGTLLNAVYRALNDVKALVRFLKKSVAEDGNPYGINPDRIIVYGHGSGGYLSLAYGSLDRFEELENEASGKWYNGQYDVTEGANNEDTLFYANELFINPAIVGDIDGFGGALNEDNHPGYSNDVLACVNVGGALGDSAWIEPGEPPIISLHVVDDEYAPFTQGTVIVPTTGDPVVDVVGSRWAIGRANELGNNDVLYGAQPYTDPYTTAANAALSGSHTAVASTIAGQELLNLDPDEYKGLFPFKLPSIQPFPFEESSPWDWWDNVGGLAEATGTVQQVFGVDQPTAQGIAQGYFDNANAGSPSMSANRGRTYLDTIQGFLAPRLHTLITSNIGVEESEFVNANTVVYPNPANDYLVVKTKEGIRITDVEIFDVTGALVRTENSLNKLSHQINGVDNLPTGLYLIKVTTDQGITTRKVMFK